MQCVMVLLTVRYAMVKVLFVRKQIILEVTDEVYQEGIRDTVIDPLLRDKFMGKRE